MRSRTGCETCRQRKLKCDEQKPVCSRCRRAKRSCVPFRGSIFRHQDGSAMVNTSPDFEHNQPPTNTSIVNAEERGTKNFTFVYVNDPYSDQTIEAETFTPQVANTPHCIIGVQDGEHGQPLQSPPSDPKHLFVPIGQPALGPEVVCYADVNPAVQHAASDSAIQQADSTAAIQQAGLASEISFHQTHEVQLERAQSLSADPVLSIQLIWYFKEAPGKWMDLFDVTAYFTFYVPRLAATRPLLRSACCALASKHIRRILESQQSASNSSLPHLNGDYWKVNLRSRNWYYESTAYYDDAIRLLMDEIARIGDLAEASPVRNNRSEEALAAIAILCVYELLDTPGPEWTAHMSALPLLETAPAQILDTLSPQPLSQRLSKRSIFWNFARQDYLYAFIHETCTRLNLDDPQFWRESGLLVGENGFLQPNYAVDISTEICPKIDEDLISHALFWILGKIVNFMAALVEFDPDRFNASPSLPSSSELSHNEITSQWERLNLEIECWNTALPPSFFSYVRTPLVEPGMDAASLGDRRNFEKITYTIPTCGSTMQNYHMACILLLMNKPSPSCGLRSTFTKRLNSYRLIQKEVIHHSRQICGISLSCPPESVRIQSVQPLFVAGQCLIEPEERGVVLDLLRGIEEDLGWATNYRVQKLIIEWEACPLS